MAHTTHKLAIRPDIDQLDAALDDEEHSVFEALDYDPEEVIAEVLRDFRCRHPELYDDALYYSEYAGTARSSDAKYDSAAHQLHYPDGTVVDGGDAGVTPQTVDQPVEWHGLAANEWFETYASDEFVRTTLRYNRVAYNLHTGELTLEQSELSLMRDSHSLEHRHHLTVELPASRISDPQLVVDAVTTGDAQIRERMRVLETFFEADVSTDAFADLSTSGVLRGILD